MSDLLVARAHGVLRLTLNRPEVYNAFNPELSAGLAEQLESAASDATVRVVVITGAEAAFSAGADISGDDAHERFDVRALDAVNRITRAVVGCPKPVVAAVNGVAAGAGLSTALACDLVVAAESATLLLAFTRIGLMPDGGSTATVAAAIGRTRAMRMALLAEPMTATAAYDAGLVSHVVPDADLVPTVDALVRRLAAGPPLAYAATKRAVNQAALVALEPALELERAEQTRLLRTTDVAEGMRAFSAKRRPEFHGF